MISLIPGMLLWLNSTYLKNIKILFKNNLIFPFLLIFYLLIGYFTFQNISTMGVYGDVDSAIQQAQVITRRFVKRRSIWWK